MLGDSSHADRANNVARHSLQKNDPLQPNKDSGWITRDLTRYEFCVVSAACAFGIGGALTFKLPGAAIGVVGGFAVGTAFCPDDKADKPPAQQPPSDKKPPFYF